MGGVSDPLSKSFKEELLAELLIRERVPAPKTPSALSNRLRVLVLSHFLIAFSALLLLFSGFLKNQREIEIFKQKGKSKKFHLFPAGLGNETVIESRIKMGPGLLLLNFKDPCDREFFNFGFWLERD